MQGELSVEGSQSVALVVREELAKYLNVKPCPACDGTRLKAEARNVKVGIRRTHEGMTAACAPWLQDQIGRAIEAEGLTLDTAAAPTAFVVAFGEGTGERGRALVRQDVPDEAPQGPSWRRP